MLEIFSETDPNILIFWNSWGDLIAQQNSVFIF